jgi:hypothetical protein
MAGWAAVAWATEGGRRPSGGPTWAGVDRELGQRGKILGKMKTGCRHSLGRNANWASELISKDFEFKIQTFKYFKTKFELRSN